MDTKLWLTVLLSTQVLMILDIARAPARRAWVVKLQRESPYTDVAFLTFLVSFKTCTHVLYCCTAFQTRFQDRRGPSVNASMNILMFCSTLQLGTSFGFDLKILTIHKTWAPEKATVAMTVAMLPAIDVLKLAHGHELARHSMSMKCLTVFPFCILFLTDRWNQQESLAGLICIRGLAEFRLPGLNWFERKVCWRLRDDNRPHRSVSC